MLAATWGLARLAATIAGLGVGWAFGGGAILWWSVRLVGKRREVTYWRSVCAHLAGGAAAAISSVACVITAMEIGGVWASTIAYAGLAIGAVLLAITIKAFLRTDVLRTAFVCVPVAGLLAASWMAMIQLDYRIRDLDWGPICRSNLEGIGHVVSMYQSGHSGKMPEDLEAIVNSGQPSSLVVCPASGRKYFYFASEKSGVALSPERMLACDYQSNHPGGDRHVLYASGTVRRIGEAEFQRQLARPENAMFARELRKRE